MTEEHRDERRKLDPIDYKRICFMVNVQDYTIRETATATNVSTKYVRRLLDQTKTETIATTVCSGCGWTFPWMDIQSHWATWTSGGIHSLTCGNYAP